MKHCDVNLSTFINFNKDNDEKVHKFKIDDIVSISKYKTFLQKITLRFSLTKFL